MRISYKNLKERIISKTTIEDISEKLFQLGHEHEIEGDIFDMEITPNRGDCFSLNGILKELNAFYEIDFSYDIYLEDIDRFDFDFLNKCKQICPKISFLKIEVDKIPSNYSEELENYFKEFDLKKNNFFTDISNFLSYETGQPTHCYDASKITSQISIEESNNNETFTTLLNEEIQLSGNNVVFKMGDKVINLAGIMGGIETSCDLSTSSVIIECAFFDPEKIIGKSNKFGIKSDAAHKFERRVDPNCHDYVLRRFINIVETNTNIKNIEIFTENNDDKVISKILFDSESVNKILGCKIEDNKQISLLEKIGFTFDNEYLLVPSYRGDVTSLNDVAEEIARLVGYDNIPVQKINIPNFDKKILNIEDQIRNLLIDNNFYEVINNPFTSFQEKSSIKIDNPLDSNKSFLRLSLRESLLNNLLYNERRQKDSIKFFEISDIYSIKDGLHKKRNIGIIASGRVGKNYIDFSKKINMKYLNDILNPYLDNKQVMIENISRHDVDSKLNNEIIYFEAELDVFSKHLCEYKPIKKDSFGLTEIQEVSEFPSSIRDLSFSLKDFTKLNTLEKKIFSFSNKILKEVFIFDYYFNEKLKEIKIGFRFIFQSTQTTIKDKDVDEVIEEIVKTAISVESVHVPGLK